MLAKLGHAAREDADVGSFWTSKPVSKVVIIITRLLTTAFAEILQALQVCQQSASNADQTRQNETKSDTTCSLTWTLCCAGTQACQ